MVCYRLRTSHCQMQVSEPSLPDPPASSPTHAPLADRPGGAWWTKLEGPAFFLFGVGLMLSVYAGHEGLPGYDSYYHVKMASMIPEHGLVREFPWLRFTYFTETGHGMVSHHYGFHVLLLPFVHLSTKWTGDPLPGARLAMATFFGLTLLLFNRLLRNEGVRWRWLWLLLFLLMPFQFFSRHAFVRAIGPSLMFMLLLLVLLGRRRYALAGLGVVGYVHLYLGGVLFAPVIVALYVVAAIMASPADRPDLRRVLLWTVGGWIVGIASHPYVGGIGEFLWLQVFGSGLSPDIPVGREWRPYEDVWWFAMMSGVLLVTWCAAITLRLRLGRSIGVMGMTLLMAHFMFLGLTFKARRFIEYWPMFCLLSAAVLAAPTLNGLAERCDRFLSRCTRKSARWLRVGAAALVVTSCLGAVLLPPWQTVRRGAASNYNMTDVGEAMAFLKGVSEPGDVVFTDDWDVFPVYFFHNSVNHYIVGLDPKFTHARRPVLWERYVKISRGQVPADINVAVVNEAGESVTQDVHVVLTDIRDHFGARFVITDREHKSLAERLAAADGFARLIYPGEDYPASRNAPYLIFRINPNVPAG